MDEVKVLIGSPICQTPTILSEFLISLQNLNKDNIITDFLFIDDNTDIDAKALLSQFKVPDCNVEIIDTNNKTEYIRTDVTHKWSHELIWKVADNRNLIIKHARNKNYTHLFILDSDIILHPYTLKNLLNQNKDIISEIFWTKWAPNSKEYPQVWLYDNYTLYEIGDRKPLSEAETKIRTDAFINMLKIPGVYKVGGLGACTLINKKALDSGVSYDRIQNVSFWGEDRHFCIRAAVLGFDLYVDTHYPAYHIYRRSELKGAQEYKIKCGYNIRPDTTKK